MKIAQDSEGSSIRPFRGGRGICPSCKTAVRAHCGDIYEWHWRHDEDTHCDYYWEPETVWHRRWKSKFPAECVEIIITKDEETHIADVRVPSGVVIEFQNSSISQQTIKVRENFYGNMVWVINAETFREHFRLRSVVNIELRELEREYESKKANICIDARIIESVNNFKDGISQVTAEYHDFNYKLQSTLNEIIRIQECKDEIDSITQKVISRLTTDVFFLDKHIQEIIDSLSDAYKNVFKDVPVRLNLLKQNTVAKRNDLRFFDGLKSYEYANVTYKLLQYHQLNNVTEEQVKNIIAIKSESAHSLFKDVVTFVNVKSYLDFESASRGYLIAFNPSDIVGRIEHSISESEQEIDKLESQIREAQLVLKVDVETFLDNKLNTLTNLVRDIEQQLSRLQDFKVGLEKDLAKAIARQNAAEQIERNRMEKEHSTRKYAAMKDNKGRYKFSWKNERKSWQASDRVMYFDIGEKYLFRKIYDGEFEKVLISEFLSRYLG